MSNVYVFRNQVLDAHGTVLDREALGLGMALRNCDIAVRRIDGRDLGAHAGSPGPATRPPPQPMSRAVKPPERPQRFRIESEMCDGLVADEREARRPDLMQGAELAQWVPPFGGKARKPLHLFGIKRRVGALRGVCCFCCGGHLSLRSAVLLSRTRGLSSDQELRRLLRGGARAAKKRRSSIQIRFAQLALRRGPSGLE